MTEYMQDKVDAAVASTSGGDNRVTVRVLAVRGDGITLHLVGTEERVRYASALSREAAEQDCSVESGYTTLDEAWDNRRDDDHGVFEIRYWSEEDEYTDAADVVASTDVDAPWMFAGTSEERSQWICDRAREQMIADGDLEEDDFEE